MASCSIQPRIKSRESGSRRSDIGAFIGCDFAKDRQIDPARLAVARFADVDQFGLDQILPVHVTGRGPVVVEIVEEQGHLSGVADILAQALALRSEEHTSELQSLMRRSYAVLCLKKKIQDKM